MSIEIIREAEFDDETGRLVSEALGRCSCGDNVLLYRFTNTCRCGRDYNQSGDLLADREQWGEETGEHWIDCL